MDATIFLANEDDEGYGYVCTSQNDTINTIFWAKDSKSKNIQYYSYANLYDKAKLYQSSMLVNLSPSHIAMHRMFTAYIDWYKNNKRL